jgi:hypothetical protein
LVAAHPGFEDAGVVADSVSRYPVTPTLSVAVKVVIATVSEVDVTGIVKDETVGGVVSAVGGRVIVVVALRLFDTFPAASFAQE